MKLNKTIPILIFILFTTFISVKVFAADWTIYNNAPILYPEPLGNSTEGKNNIYAPEVIREGNLWRMWYGGQGTQTTGNDRIHYAESSDGINWVKKGVAINIQSGEVHANDPSIIKINNTYYMYFTVTKAINGKGIDVIDLATSTNGLTWSRQGTVLSKSQSWEGSVGIARPAVINDNGVYKMWYDSLTPSYAMVGYATSTDGKVWQKYTNNPVLVESVGAVDVKKIDNLYYMVHQPAGANFKGPVYWLTSTDGINWVNKGALFNKTGGADDYNGHVTPFIYVENGIWTRTYFGGMWGDANNPDWFRGRIYMAYRYLYTCKVQGMKLLGINNITNAGISGALISTDFSSSSSSPYYLGIPEGTYSISVLSPSFYKVGFTMCKNVTDCHSGPWVVSNTVSATCKNGDYIDLWWHFYPENGDINKDSKWDMMDVVNLIKNLFL